MRRSCLLATAILLALATRPAAAEDDPRGYVLANLGLGAPSGLLGGTAGLYLAPRLSAEVSAGIGLTGGQFAVLMRSHIPRSWLRSWSFAAGPSVSVLDIREPEHDEFEPSNLRFATGVNGEVAFDGRLVMSGIGADGLKVRIAAGVYRRLFENMSDACAARPDGFDRCGGSLEVPGRPALAELDWFPYLSIGLGFDF